MSTVTNALPLPHVYYDHPSRLYWMQDGRGVWIRLSEESVKRQLIVLGHSRQRGDQELSPVDQCLQRLQLNQNVDYAGGLAGHLSGYREFNGTRMLVTRNPDLIVPREIPFPLITAILRGMLVDGDIDQRPYFWGWMKIALQSYRNHRWSPGQALALVGPPRAGKSLLQNLITEFLGGRCTDAYPYISGRSTFNSEMFGAEHLMLEDKTESSRIETRLEMASRIKEITANANQKCSTKHRESIQLDPIWRITISLNNEPDRIMVLPPIAPDIADKLMLLKVNRQDMPMPAATDEEKQAFRRAISAEMPGFVHWLEGWRIPNELVEPRYGIRHFHHPELVELLEDSTPETRFLNLIDRELFGRSTRHGLLHPNGEVQPPVEPWVGSALQLEQHLCGSCSSVRREAERLMRYSSACGSMLGRLAQRRPDRVSRRILHGETRWTLHPPAQEPAEAIPGMETTRPPE
jgi:hypothetical protein